VAVGPENEKMPEQPSVEELARRVRWFEDYTDELTNRSIRLPKRDRPYPCPCCGYLTLDERGEYQICPVCFWEDDGQDVHDADVIRGGPNGDLSLTQARQNFDSFGATRKRFLAYVRNPKPHEHALGEQG
jgi:hypothetical protein